MRINWSPFLKLNEPLSSKSMLSLTQLIFLGQIILQFAFRVESTKVLSFSASVGPGYAIFPVSFLHIEKCQKTFTRLPEYFVLDPCKSLCSSQFY